MGHIGLHQTKPKCKGSRPRKVLDTYIRTDKSDEPTQLAWIRHCIALNTGFWNDSILEWGSFGMAEVLERGVLERVLQQGNFGISYFWNENLVYTTYCTCY